MWESFQLKNKKIAHFPPEEKGLNGLFVRILELGLLFNDSLSTDDSLYGKHIISNGPCLVKYDQYIAAIRTGEKTVKILFPVYISY